MCELLGLLCIAGLLYAYLALGRAFARSLVCELFGRSTDAQESGPDGSGLADFGGIDYF